MCLSTRAFSNVNRAPDKKRERRAQRDTPLAIQENQLGLESLLGDGSQLVEGLDVLVSHLSQDLAVKLDTGNLQAVHELRVRDVVQASSSVDTSDPERTDLALLVAAITILILQGVLDLLFSMLVSCLLYTSDAADE